MNDPVGQAVPEDQFLLSITLPYLPNAADGDGYTVVAGSGIRVWQNNDRSGLISSQLIPPGNGQIIYIEGTSQSTSNLEIDVHYHGDVEKDTCKINVFTLIGALNAPEHAILDYTATGGTADSKWIGDATESVKTGVATSNAGIQWDAGPIQGMAAYFVNQDYTWDLGVSVVHVDVGAPVTDQGAPTYRGLSQQMGTGIWIYTVKAFKANAFGVLVNTTVTLTGPGNNRCVSHIQVGYV